jgi:hypothetical protein
MNKNNQGSKVETIFKREKESKSTRNHEKRDKEGKKDGETQKK